MSDIDCDLSCLVLQQKEATIAVSCGTYNIVGKLLQLILKRQVFKNSLFSNLTRIAQKIV
jgi:hypothetical protein